MNKNIEKLHWGCRRGMLELDLILGKFLQQAYPQLPEAQQNQFEMLLTYPDPCLFDWLIGKAEPDEAVQAIIMMIRDHARNAISN